MEQFVKASRLALRFDTPKGLLTTEDLWNLPLTSHAPGKPNLDDIAVGLHNKLQTKNTVSFVNTPAKADESDQIAFEKANSPGRDPG